MDTKEPTAEEILSTKCWSTMTSAERHLCIRHMVSKSESEDDLRRHLEEAGIDAFDDELVIIWRDASNVSLKECMRHGDMGGLTARNGALVGVRTKDYVGLI